MTSTEIVLGRMEFCPIMYDPRYASETVTEFTHKCSLLVFTLLVSSPDFFKPVRFAWKGRSQLGYSVSVSLSVV